MLYLPLKRKSVILCRRRRFPSLLRSDHLGSHAIFFPIDVSGEKPCVTMQSTFFKTPYGSSRTSRNFLGHDVFPYLWVVHDLVWWAIACVRSQTKNLDSRKHLLDFFPMALLARFVFSAVLDEQEFFWKSPPPPSKK